MNGKDSQAHASSNQTWAEALAEYEGGTKWIESLLGYAMGVTYLWFVAIFVIGLDYAWEYKLIGVLVLIVILVIPKPKLTKNYEQEGKEELLNRIKASGLAERIKSGSLHNDQIREQTHPLARWAVPSLREGNKLDLLKRLGKHLDWYLVPPTPLYKEAGLVGVALAGVVVLIIVWLVTGDPASIILGSWKWLPFPLFALSFFSHTVYEHYSNRVAILGEYIVNELSDHQQAPTKTQINNALVQSLEGGLHRDYNMDLIINQCDKVLEQYKQMPNSTFFLIIFPMIFWFSKPNSPWSEVLNWVFPIGVLLAIMWLDTLVKRKSVALQAKYSKRLESENLAARILLGDATKAQLKRHIPRIFNMSTDGLSMANLPTGEGAEVSADIICVALNLDWYLEHPKPLIRRTWIAFSILFVAGAGFAVAKVFAASAAGSIPIWAWIILGTAGFAFWITLLLEGIRIRAGSLALIEHLREGRN